MRRIIAIVGCGVLCFLVGSAAAGDVVLTAAAAHDSLLGVEFTVEGKNDKSYIENLHPDGESTYRTSFWFDPSRLNLGDKTRCVIFEAVGPNPDGDSGEARVFDIRLSRNKKGQFKIQAYGYQEPGSRSKNVRTKTINIDSVGWNHITLEWRAASSNSSPDGLLRLSIDGGAMAGKSSEAVGTALNARLVIDKIRIGAVRGVDATTAGFFSIDTFESFRDLASD